MSLLTKKRYRLVPCPSYDVETMESWLEDEALDGYFLIEDGFLFGVGTFVKGEPSRVRYRLEPKEVMDWSQESLFPNAAARELCEEYGWKYVADRGQFFIYRSEAAAARELNTDPEIQAMALQPMWDHVSSQLWTSVFWIAAYPLIRYLLGRETLLRMCIYMGTWLFAMGLGIGVWLLIRSLARLHHIAGLRRRLKAGVPLQRGRDWRRRKKPYWIGNALYLLLIVTWVCCVFQGCAKDLEKTDRVPLDEYVAAFAEAYGAEYEAVQKTAPDAVSDRIFPFADMVELVERSLEKAGDVNEQTQNPAREQENDSTMADDLSLYFEESGMYPGDMNYVIAKKDLLAPTFIRMNQNGSVWLPDGREFEAILYVDYYETVAPWVARVLTWEYLREGRANKHYSEIALPDLPVDEAYCFTAYLPTLVLRKGDVVMVVELVQFVHDARDYELEPAQWARIFAESMK